MPPTNVAFEGFSDSPMQVREKKAALLEVIELQRAYIERGCPEAPATPTAEIDVSDGATNSADDAEMRWYTDQATRLEKFKAALNAVRLQPDEFPLLVPECWAVRDESAASSRELVPYVLRINARSQLTFVPMPPPSARGPAPAPAAATPDAAPPELRPFASSASSDSARDDASSLAGSLGVPRVIFMDQMRQVRLAPPSDSGAAAAAPSAESSGSAAAQLSSSPKARTLSIELFGEAALSCVTPEAAELVEVLGAHLRRYNTSRVSQVAALKRLHALKSTPYDGRIKQHESLLQRLWACAFGPESKFHLISDRWIHLGFQCADPTKDFRGMGILGLSNLVYFGEHYGDVFQRLVAAQKKRDYPLACAGINITSLLLELLHMRDDGDPAALQARPPFDPGWSGDMFAFFCHMFYREQSFEDMYCFCLRLLDRMFVAMDADYADFNTVLAALRLRLIEALAQRPLSFREFKRLIAAGGAESDGSQTSDTISRMSLSSITSTDRQSLNGSSGPTSMGEDGSGMNPDDLRRTIAEAMGTLPKHLDGLRNGLKGALMSLRPPPG